jgi:hypothetical protein
MNGNHQLLGLSTILLKQRYKLKSYVESFLTKKLVQDVLINFYANRRHLLNYLVSFFANSLMMFFLKK